MYCTSQKWGRFKFVLVLLVLKLGCHQTRARERFHQSEACDASVLLEEWPEIGRAAANSTWCQYRDLRIPYNSEVFRLQSSFGCYSYTAPSRFNPEVGPYNASSSSSQGLPYQLVMIDGVKYNVDYTDRASIELISKSLLTPQDTQKWIACSKAAEDCCRFMLTHPNTWKGCPNTWDGWYCWHEAPVNTVQHGVCPDYIYSGSAPICHHQSSKRCFSNATWNVTTSYVKCAINTRIEERTIYHVTMLSISLALSVPAIVIFFSYRKLRNTMRVILNRNLLIAIAVRNLLTIISKTTVILDAITAKIEADSIMARNGVGCKILASLDKLSTNAVFACMLLLGIYLHRLIAAAFKGEPRMLMFFVGAAVISTVPVIAWMVVTALLNNQYCWTVDENGYQWINDSVKIAMLTVNMVLIVDIIRVLLTKLRSVDSMNSNIRRTTKVTIFLLPVFGVQFVFTAARPNTTNCTGEQVFYFFSYGFDGLQGAVVSLLFCYFNKEVRSLLCKTTTTVKNKVHMHLDKDYVPRNSDGQGDPRRLTVSTMVDPNPRLSVSPLQNAHQPHPGPTTQPNQFFNTIGTFPQELFGTPKSSEADNGDAEYNFFTPENSEVGSPPSDRHIYYSPRSSLTGSSLDVNIYYSPRSSYAGNSSIDASFYDCIDDDPFEVAPKSGNAEDDRETLGQQRKENVTNSDGFVNAAEEFNNKFQGASVKYTPGNSQLSFAPAEKQDGRQYYDNYGFSSSSENLPDDIKSVLRKRNASVERGPDETEA